MGYAEPAHPSQPCRHKANPDRGRADCGPDRPGARVARTALSRLRTGINASVTMQLFIIGIGIGSGVDTNATDAMLRWPQAFVVLGVMLEAML